MSTLQACLNGGRAPGEHPALPLTPAALAEAAAGAVAAGASSLHIHPRDATGRERLDAATIGAALAATRAACPGIPVGVSTGAWIEPDPSRRRAAVASWDLRPDFASVNFSEAGAPELCATLTGLGVGIEAGIWTVADARLLGDVRPPLVRVLVEAMEPDLAAAEASIAAIERVLGDLDLHAPRLVHGQDATAWPVLGAAAGRGRAVRIGLEDVLVLADGRPARDNAELVQYAARTIEKKPAGSPPSVQ